MKKEIYQDGAGNFYFVEYDKNNKPYKVYCDKYGNPMEVEVEIYQDKAGNLYFIDYDKAGKKYKVYCDEYGNPIKANNNKQEGTKKTKILKFSYVVSIFAIIIALIATYFAYQRFFNDNKQANINLSAYEVNFVTSGNEGQGKANIEIKKVPEVTNTKVNNSELNEALKKPEISYSKNSDLKNGDRVDVTIKLKEEDIKKYNLHVSGEFKKTYTVSGLAEKEKENKVEEKVIEDKVAEENATPEERVAEDTAQSASNEVANVARPDTQEQEEIIITEVTPSSTVEKAPIYEVSKTVIPEIGVNLRQEPNDTSLILDAVRQGYVVQELYTLLNDAGEYWSRVVYDGKEGWIRSDLLY
ncbi:SH3 domain-containing protein [Gemella sp. zg-570]|uniref:SH3 domain-containing protein n=1 Tax=Gemella sp. zg-570 TaxID=2840371 RepID=UPI001C0CE856|nr:SH3 domain-containing protein [Gemella sp. zg-570]QWQ38775.1 SH3 domain-containing protein [Gemella sp. zg-570]